MILPNWRKNIFFTTENSLPTHPSVFTTEVKMFVSYIASHHFHLSAVSEKIRELLFDIIMKPLFLFLPFTTIKRFVAWYHNKSPFLFHCMGILWNLPGANILVAMVLLSGTVWSRIHRSPMISSPIVIFLNLISILKF